MAMAVSQRPFVAPASARTCRAAPVKALPNADRIKQAAAGVVVAISLSAAPALAGVQFENQPAVKKAFQKSEEVTEKVEKTAEKAVSQASEGIKFEAPKLEAPKFEIPGPELSVQALWPVGIIASGGILFGISKLDSGFAEMLESTSSRDSSVLGAGYEDSLKGPGGYAAPYYEEAGVGGGTKALKGKKRGRK